MEGVRARTDVQGREENIWSEAGKPSNVTKGKFAVSYDDAPPPTSKYYELYGPNVEIYQAPVTQSVIQRKSQSFIHPVIISQLVNQSVDWAVINKLVHCRHFFLSRFGLSCLGHKWGSIVLRYHEIIVIYPSPFLV